MELFFKSDFLLICEYKYFNTDSFFSPKHHSVHEPIKQKKHLLVKENEKKELKLKLFLFHLPLHVHVILLVLLDLLSIKWKTHETIFGLKPNSNN